MEHADSTTVTPLLDGLMAAGLICQELEEERRVTIETVTWQCTPGALQIYLPTRHDFEVAAEALDLVIGEPYGRLESPIINANGAYRNVTVVLIGRALA